jgi:hypothetical protein
MYFRHCFGRRTTCIDGSLDRADVSFDDDADQSAAGLLFGHQSHVRRLNHRVRCHSGSIQTDSLDEAESFS